MDIVVQNLTKVYGIQKAVNDISFTVKTGQVVGFLGPNGAGKTTTMKAITTFLTPTSGEIKIGEFSVTDDPDKVKTLIGYLPEHNPLYEDMPVIDYLRFVANLYQIPKNEVNNRIREMIVTCGLEVEKHKKIGELSKGYRQRVGLAQAMIHNPQVLILDEPTTGLDPNQIAEIRELIRKIGREKTVILSSHILAEIEATCDRVLIIRNGIIVADGTPNELKSKSQGKEIVNISIVDGEYNEIFTALQNLPTVGLVDVVDKSNSTFSVQSKTDVTPRKEIFKLCVDRGWTIMEMTPVKQKLEDIFRELTTN